MTKKQKYLVILILIVLTFAAFIRIVNNDFINFDDNVFITENPYIKAGFNKDSIKWALTTTYLSYWHPLTFIFFILEWNIFGQNAAGYHLISLFLHIGAVLFLFLFLYKTTKTVWPSAIVAAFFALHPLRVESVAWASELKDVLSMFFGMATLYIYSYYVENKKISLYLLCLFLFVLSLMSKPILVTLPFVMLLVDYWPLQRWKALNQTFIKAQAVVPEQTKKKKKKERNKQIVYTENKKLLGTLQNNKKLSIELLWEKVPFFIISFILGIMVILQLKFAGGMVALEKVSLNARIANAFVSYIAYLGKIFWPNNLSIIYPYRHFLQSWQVFASVIILLTISIIAIYLAKKIPSLIVGWLWYLGTLLPVIGLFQAGSQAMADRYTYLSSIGIFIMLVWGFLQLVPKQKINKYIFGPVAGISIAILTFLTWQQCSVWKNSFTVFNHAIKVTKNNYVAHKNLGTALAKNGKNDEAIHHFLTAIKIYPPDYITRYDLAVLYQKTDNINQAIDQYKAVLKINPNHSSAHVNLGSCLAIQNEYDEATYHFRQALKTDPNDAGIHFNLGVVQLNKGDLKSAAESFRTALYLNPNFDEAKQGLQIVSDINNRTKH